MIDLSYGEEGGVEVLSHPSPIPSPPSPQRLVSPSLPPYQDVWEAEVIFMTRCRTLRNGSEQAATLPFSLGIVGA